MYWILAIALALFVALLLSFTRTILKMKGLAKTSRILHDAALKNENLLIDPYWGSFRGSTGKYGKIKCDGIIALTEKNLIFEKLVGESIVILVKSIISASKEDSFIGQKRVGGVLVLNLNDSSQLGFTVRDIDRWIDYLPKKDN